MTLTSFAEAGEGEVLVSGRAARLACESVQQGCICRHVRHAVVLQGVGVGSMDSAHEGGCGTECDEEQAQDSGT